jgi:hypothetical protein
MLGAALVDVDGVVAVSDDLRFDMTDESAWQWDGGELHMTGGAGAAPGNWGGWSTLEIGGADMGTDPVGHIGDPLGFVDNFDLDELVIGPGARVYLADLFDNGNRPGGAAEALYVDTLTFADGLGVLNLNDLHLYYNTLNGDAGQIIDVVVPEPACAAILAIGALALLRRRAGR